MPESESWQPIADTLGFKDEHEMLTNLYICQEFSLAQLKSMLGFSTWAIRRRLILNQIPMRPKGGANNRIGKRRLKHLTTEELTETPAVRLAEKHNVHLSTVYSEIRFREQEIRDAILSNHADKRIREVRESLQMPHGSGAASEAETLPGVLPAEDSRG